MKSLVALHFACSMKGVIFAVAAPLLGVVAAVGCGHYILPVMHNLGFGASGCLFCSCGSRGRRSEMPPPKFEPTGVEASKGSGQFRLSILTQRRLNHSENFEADEHLHPTDSPTGSVPQLTLMLPTTETVPLGSSKFSQMCVLNREIYQPQPKTQNRTSEPHALDPNPTLKADSHPKHPNLHHREFLNS